MKLHKHQEYFLCTYLNHKIRGEVGRWDRCLEIRGGFRK
jgi:hypothetical protein